METAFRRGCEVAALPYINPHAARHNVALRKDDYCRNDRQRKAWSFNMGHEKEITTELNYAKMTDTECNDQFVQLAETHGETIEDKDLMIVFQMGELTPGTPEHTRADKLMTARWIRKNQG